MWAAGSGISFFGGFGRLPLPPGRKGFIVGLLLVAVPVAILLVMAYLFGMAGAVLFVIGALILTWRPLSRLAEENRAREAAIRLEHIADASETGAYPFALIARADGLVLDWEPLIRAVLDDVAQGIAPAIMAARFQNGLIRAIVEIARTVDQPRVALTGGCFQNRLLTEGACAALSAAGFDVLMHRQTPPNDGCVSLGQVAVAAAQLRDKNGPHGEMLYVSGSTR